ncbi:MAG TPA: response regulator [Deltaproteobacteria bacterium]|nr:response regulator [Deltaproteobacteria bacterium]
MIDSAAVPVRARSPFTGYRLSSSHLHGITIQSLQDVGCYSRRSGMDIANIAGKTRSVIGMMEKISMKILVVDDDVQFASVIIENLNEWGYDAETAPSAADALEKLRSNIFDLVLLDLFLPDCRGYDLIPQLRRIRLDIDVITMTAYNTRDIEKKVRLQRVLYYMTKPFDVDQLRYLLDYLEKTRAHRYETKSTDLPFLKGFDKERL